MSDFESVNITLNRGEVLYVEGDSSETIYHLTKGNLELTRNAETVTFLDQRGDPLGFSESILQIPRLTTVRAQEESLLKQYELKGKKVYDWINEHPLTGLRIMRNNAEILNFLNKKNKELFESFRESRGIFEELLEPLSEIWTEVTHDKKTLPDDLYKILQQKLDDSLLRTLARNYRTVVNSTGRSVKQAASDLSVPDDVQKDFKSGEKICEEGSEDDSFYILLEGTLSVLKEGQRVANIDEPGSIFGEMAALLSGERTATIIADTESRVAVFPYDRLRDHFEDNTKLSDALLKTFLKRLQRGVTLNKSLTNFLSQIREINEAGELPEATIERLRTIVKALKKSSTEDNRLEKSAERIEEFLDEGFEQLGMNSL